MEDKIYYGKEALKMAIDGHKMVVEVVEEDKGWRQGEVLQWCPRFTAFTISGCSIQYKFPEEVGFKVHKEPKFKKGNPVKVWTGDGSYTVKFVEGYIEKSDEYKLTSYSDLSGGYMYAKEENLTLIGFMEIG